MTDARLRELERRWQESGTIEDERRYLQEGVRSGLYIETGCILLTGNHGAKVYLSDRVKTLEWPTDESNRIMSMAVARISDPDGEALHLLSDILYSQLKVNELLQLLNRRLQAIDQNHPLFLPVNFR